MIMLVSPSTVYRESFFEAMDEQNSDQAEFYDFLGITRNEMENDFAGFVSLLNDNSIKRTDKLVPEITLWGIVDNKYAGRISLRLELNRNLLDIGGNIGYEVRPSLQGRGYATKMLRKMLEVARFLGILRVLVTCDETNFPSKRVIEKTGAFATEPLMQKNGIRKLRYWICTVPESEAIQNAVSNTLSYLNSKKAMEDISADPYWPKWDSPWWHMKSLADTGLTHLIPKEIIEHLMDCFDRHYLHFFPIKEDELPQEIDPCRNIICHCQMGTVLMILREFGFNVIKFFPWIVPWIEKYQMSDGGFNCDEKAYTSIRPVSSIVSTLPMLEMLLMFHRFFELNVSDALFMGFNYLIAHRFNRSVRTGKIINNDWLKPIWPRFYEYDTLRGLSFAMEYIELMSARAYLPQTNEAYNIVNQWFMEGSEIDIRFNLAQKSLIRQQNNRWAYKNASSFALLDALSVPQEAMRYLSVIWNRVNWIRNHNCNILSDIPL